MRRLLTILGLAVGLGALPAPALAAPPGTAPPDTSTGDTVVVDTVPAGTAPVDTGSVPAGGPVATVAPAGGSAPGDLVVVPAGCASAPPASAVFTGTIVARSELSARYRVEQVRYGSLTPQQVGDLVDVTYGRDVRYLAEGRRYLVGVALDEGGRLTSKVREPTPLFGGDAVIGINDSDVSCPRVEDPVRTLQADGTPLDVGVLTPLNGSKGRLLRAILLPVGIAFAALVVLAATKLLGQAAFRAAFSPDETLGPPRRR